MGEMNEQVHRLLLEQRKTLSLGGVQDVKSFDENEVLLVTVCGVLTIRGKRAACGPPGAGKGRGGYRRQHRQPGLYGTWAAAEEGVCACAGCSGKNECVCHPGADSARLFHLAGGSPGVLVRSDQDSAETDPPQPCGGICRGTSATGLRQRCICLYGFTERTAAFSVGICLAASLGALPLYHASFGRFLPELLAKGIKKAGRILAFPGKWLVKSMKKQRKRLKFHGKNGKM